MLTEKELQELLKFEATEKEPVVSLYLDVDLTRHTKDKCLLVLRGLLKDVSSQADKADLEKIQDFFDLEYDWQARGLAIFSCDKQGLWRVYPLGVPVPNAIYAQPQPYIHPLANLLAEYERYGVVLISREQARFFALHMGELYEYEGTSSSVPGHHKQGGWAQARYQRHIEEHAAQHLRNAAEALAALYKKEKWGRLILAGTEENVSLFESSLPKNLQDLIIGSFAVDMTAPLNQIKREALAVAEAFEKERDAKLVEEMVTRTAKGGAAVTGLDDTLNAVKEGRVQILLVAEGFHAPGKVCESCGYVTVQEINRCPFCSVEMKHVADVVERAVRQTIEMGGTVNIVKDNEALEKAGSIGALLRY